MVAEAYLGGIFGKLLEIITEPFMIGGLFISGIILHKFFHRKDALFALFIFIVLIVSVSGGASLALKEHFGIERPCAGKTLSCPTDKSFPSGHATVSFAVFSFLFFLNGRWVASETILAFPFIISLARVLQGVHTIADISFGAILGTLTGLIFSRIHIFSNSLAEKKFRRDSEPINGKDQLWKKSEGVLRKESQKGRNL